MDLYRFLILLLPGTLFGALDFGPNQLDPAWVDNWRNAVNNAGSLLDDDPEQPLNPPDHPKDITIIGDPNNLPGEGTSGQGGQTTDPVIDITQFENLPSNIDTDNDVPTLQAILAKLDYLDQDNDNALLQQILDELIKQNDNTQLDNESKEFSDLEFENSTENILPSNIDLLGSMNPSGSLPALSLQVPGINGPSSVSVDLTDPKFDTLYAVARFGITAVFVFGSARFTSWTSGQLLSS